MLWLNIALVLFMCFLMSLYFMPYRKIKGKIFKRLLYKTDEIGLVEFAVGKEVMSFERVDAYTWNMIMPDKWKVDSSKMRRLMLCLTDINVEDRITKGDVDDPKYNIGRNGTLCLYTASKKIIIEIGGRVEGNDELIYLSKSDDKDVLLVAAHLLLFIPKSADDFKNMFIFEAYYPQIKALEAGNGGTRYTLIRTDTGGWLLKNKHVFDEKVEPIITELLGIKANSFVDRRMKLAAKSDAYISLKINKQTITRHFFIVANDPNNYLMPLDGEILKVDKIAVDRIINFS